MPKIYFDEDANLAEIQDKVEEEAAERSRLRAIIERIRNGQFAKEWTLEQHAGEPMFSRIRQQNLKHPLVKAKQELYKPLGRLKD